MATRQRIVDVAREYIGTPWKHQAALKGVGIDCVNLLACVAYECGLGDARPLARNEVYRAYGREPLPEVLFAGCEEYLDRIPLSQATLADILLMKVPGGAYPQHFSIVSAVDDDGKPLYMIHATSGAPRRVVENRIDDATRARLFRAYRFKGID